MAARKNNAPTSGTRHGNGSGRGDGWGGATRAPGEPKGTRADKTLALFKPANQAAVNRRGSEAAQALKDHLFDLARNAERQETQVTAAVAWLNRHEGTPIARNINLTPDDVSVLDDGTLTAIALGKSAETTH